MVTSRHFRVLVPALVSVLAAQADSGQRTAQSALNRVARGFVENGGQIDAEDRFSIRTPDFTVQVSDDRVSFYVVHDWTEIALPDGMDPAVPRIRPHYDRVDFRFENAASTAQAIGEYLRADFVNHFFVRGGQLESATNLSTFEIVRLANVYEGIDVTMRRSGSGIEYDIEAAPGADLSQVRIRVDGASNLTIGPDDSLEITTRHGAKLRQRAPTTFAVNAVGNRRSVQCTPELIDRDCIGFEVGARAPDERVVIDPIVDKPEYFTFLGGSDAEFAFDIAHFNGRATITGCTVSLTTAQLPPAQNPSYIRFPLHSQNISPPPPPPIQNTYVGGFDIFVSQFDSTGLILKWTTYLSLNGGASQDFDIGHGIDIDANGAVYVVGYTQGDSLATGLQGTTGFDLSGNGQGDGFLFKLTTSGSVLSYFNFLGGGFPDVAEDVKVDGSGNAYVTGWTDSTVSPAFPTNPSQSISTGGFVGFLTKVDPAGTSLVFSRFILDDLSIDESIYGIRPRAVALENDDIEPSRVRAWIAGDTEANMLPIVGAFQNANAGGKDGFVLRVNPSGSTIEFCSFLGGEDHDRLNGIDISPTGVATVCGATKSLQFPSILPLSWAVSGGGTFVHSALQGPSDVAFARIDPSQVIFANRLIQSSHFGGMFDEAANCVAVDSSGASYVVGFTASGGALDLFPQIHPYYSPTDIGPRDAFVIKVVNSTIVMSSFLGGRDTLSPPFTGEDSATGIVLDSSGMHICGITTSPEFAQNLGLTGFSVLLASGGITGTVFGGGLQTPDWNINNLNDLEVFDGSQNYPANLVGADAFVTRLGFRAN